MAIGGELNSKKLISYCDTPETKAYRQEMLRINEWLEKGDIQVQNVSMPDVVIDAGDRHLRRIFNDGTFGKGGRLFGGFWQPMKKVDRKEMIIINDETIRELDYGQMTARMLYGLSGVSAKRRSL